ncbi:hypothetical protein IAQ61_001533 [Plenodomus lingam]|uniref:uncharacterized protein n=1 Tax=Leptosphaeria maculans TaxID=5022 RepID=UPI0033268E2F|nr:hypothetical protein IAQ61_001533 [Plenodomus lingam]
MTHTESQMVITFPTVGKCRMNQRQAGSVESNHLRNKIAKVIKDNPIGLNPEGTYMPDKQLDQLLTAETVQCALGGLKDMGLVTFILERACKCFAILQLVFTECGRRRQAIEWFRKTKFGDDILDQTKYERVSKVLQLCGPQCTDTEHDCKHYFPANMPWDTTELETFSEKRWHFLLPIFRVDQFIYEINAHQFLPFTERDTTEGPGDGHFSEVFCVRMLAKHQTKIKTKEDTIRVALKSLKQIPEPRYDIEKEWRREAKAYQQLDDANRQFIRGIAAVRQVATYHQHNDNYHLVLEWADGGSLHSFWEANPDSQIGINVKQSRERMLEMLEQLHGLADALEYMHTSSSRSSGRSQCGSPQRSRESSPTGIDPISDFGHLSTMQLPQISLPIRDLVQEPEDMREHDRGLPEVSVTPSTGDMPTANHRRLTTMTSDNWRHGDIKTENILRFKGGKEDVWLGTLKLADLGRAQQHSLKTELRTTKEKEPWRTIWYEPPDLIDEVHVQAQGKISRLFDVWSMGCVIFETVLWLLYGKESIEEFLRANDLGSGEQAATPYWRKQPGEGYQVSQAASAWMKNILETDPEREGAIGDLIRLVKDRLLKIKLPRHSEIYSPGFRTNASDMRKELKRILDHAGRDKNYLFSGKDRTMALPPKTELIMPPTSISKTGSSLSPRDAEDRDHRRRHGRATIIAQQRVYTNTLGDGWITCGDDSFVDTILRDRQFSDTQPDKCPDCDGVDVLSEKLSFAVDHLVNNAGDEECDICELVHSTLQSTELTKNGHIVLERSDDCFVMKDTGRKLLRLCQISTSEYDLFTCLLSFIFNLDLDASSAHKDIPIGAPTLLAPPSELNYNSDDGFVKLLRAWVHTCDEAHSQSCQPNVAQTKLPKRLIHVRSQKKPKLVETRDLDPKDIQDLRYIAFSHRWGNMPTDAVTTLGNVEKRKNKLITKGLPKSFQNAISVADVLKCDYLWIDSLCILQGPDGDFNDEADTMQDIFSNAYCVIAACDADGRSDGFLRKKQTKTIYQQGTYLSSVTNDFERDVLQSPLNRRGWVLQERALARRTIFFTRNQMYFECGDGIRCETLAKLKNDEVAFLGDPIFPNYTIRENSTRGSQIHLFTRLFEMYSKLEFSHREDKPIAIDGLMHRLTAAFKTISLAGMFKAFWGRCLLWQRAGSQALEKIAAGAHTKRLPPTWSWLAYHGAISFLEPAGGKVEWNSSVHLPFANRAQSSWLKTSNRSETNALFVDVFPVLPIGSNANKEKAMISFDDGQSWPVNEEVMCFIVGTEKQTQSATETETNTHFVVLVKRMDGPDSSSFERIGVGHFPGSFISWEPKVYGKIE